MTMLTMYRPTIGAAKIVCVIMSPLGVITAAMMKMIRKAYLKFDKRKRAVISFIFAIKKTTAGIWNTMPMPIIIFVYKPKTSSSLGMNASSAVLKLAKNFIMNG